MSIQTQCVSAIRLLLTISLVLVFRFGFSQNPNTVDSLQRLGVSKVCFDISLAKNCARQISLLPNLSYVQKARLNYLKYKIHLFEIERGTIVQPSFGFKGKQANKNIPTWQRGVDLINSGKSEEGLSLLYRFLEKNRTAVADSLIDFVELNIAHTYIENMEYEKAIKLLKDIIVRPSITPNHKADACSYLERIYRNNQSISFEERFDSTLKYINLAINIAAGTKQSVQLALYQYDLATLYRLENTNLDSAKYYADKAFQSFIANNKYAYAFNNSILLSDILIRQGKLEQALEPLHRVHDLMSIDEEPQAFMRLYLQMAKCNELLKKYNDAYVFLSVGRHIQEKSYRANTRKQINEMAAKYELSIKEALLQEQKHKISHQKSRLIIIGLLGSTILLTFLLVLLILLRQRQKQRQIIEHQKKLGNIRTEEEQKRISFLKMVHDDNKKLLFRLTENLKEILMEKDINKKNGMLNEQIRFCTKSKSMDAQLEFYEHIDTIDSAFYGRITEKYPALTVTEQKICSLLRYNLTSKEIADKLNKQPETIKWHRKKIRKKLDLSSEIDLKEFCNRI